MSPDEIERVQQSFAVLAEPDRLARVFYDRLFAAVPETRALFPTDLGTQRQKLAEQLAVIVGALDDTAAVVATTRELGRRHGGYGTRVGHYDAVGEALVAAVVACSPEGRLDEPTQQAWRRAYRLVAESMMQGAAEG